MNWRSHSRLLYYCTFLILLKYPWSVFGSYRLPRTTMPQTYEITLDVNPDPEDFYRGFVRITCKAQATTSQVVLHSSNLNLTNVNLYKEGKDIFSAFEQSTNETHFLSLSLTEELSPGDEFKIEISFTGLYYNYQSGIFRDSYKDSSGHKRYLLGTQMEAISARTTFPCYDEPDHKAIFLTEIICPSGYHVVSNTPLSSSIQLSDQNKIKFSFQWSPLMAVYLVAFVVSDFANVSNDDEDVEQFIFNKEFKCFVKPDNSKNMNYSLDFGQRVLSTLEEYTDVEYDMDKMYNVGVPTFGGAMENWGLVIYGERYLAERRNKEGEIINKETIASIMAHEFAHMWFGNEVTPKWWDNVWLSEGFATYFQYYATSLVEQSWNYMDDFVTRTMHISLFYDSYKYFKSMNGAANTPKEINRKFNFISYNKAGSVIRMMQHVLGEKTFRKGLQIYLKSIPKGSTLPRILYEGMQTSADQSDEAVLPKDTTVHAVMGSWADQAGYPLINISRSGKEDGFIVQQRRFYRDQNISSNELWWVPLNWVTESTLDFGNTSPQHWIPPQSSDTISIQDSSAYYILNKQQTGYYRIMYDEENWKAIMKVLEDEPNQIHELNRAQLIDDSMEFSDIGIMPYNTSMRLLSYLARETHPTPWSVAERVLKRLQVRMRSSLQYHLFEKLIQNLNAKRIKQLGFHRTRNENKTRQTNRRNAVHLACAFNSEECLSNEINQWFRVDNLEQWGAILCAKLRAVAVRELPIQWTVLWKSLINTNDHETRSNLLEGVSCIPSTTILNQLLKQGLNSQAIDTHETQHLLENIISSTSQGARLVLEFLHKNMQHVKDRLWGDEIVSNIFKRLGENLTSKSDIAKVEQLLSRWGDVLSGKESEDLEVMLIVARDNLKWIQDKRSHLENWLLQNVK